MFNFDKKERLKSRKVIGQLFKKSESFAVYPVRIVWCEKTIEPSDEAKNTPTFPVQMTLTVPKKTFKTAVARNVLRRRMREAYRLHKHLLYENLTPNEEKQYAFMFIYTGKETLDYAIIEQSIQKIIRRFLHLKNTPAEKKA